MMRLTGAGMPERLEGELDGDFGGDMRREKPDQKK